MSSTKSEYTGLLSALCDAIPMMELLKEMKHQKVSIRSVKGKVHCQVFKDNIGALEMAKVHKYRRRTKHLNVKLHHFRSYVESKQILIHPISTTKLHYQAISGLPY